MKVAWPDVDFTDTEGDFNTRFGLVTVRHPQIAIWKDEPNALFTLIPYSTVSPPKRGFVLGTYEVPD